MFEYLITVTFDRKSTALSNMNKANIVSILLYWCIAFVVLELVVCSIANFVGGKAISLYFVVCTFYALVIDIMFLHRQDFLLAKL